MWCIQRQYSSGEAINGLGVHMRDNIMEYELPHKLNYRSALKSGTTICFESD